MKHRNLTKTDKLRALRKEIATATPKRAAEVTNVLVTERLRRLY